MNAPTAFFFSHLRELRTRILRSVGMWLLVLCLCLPGANSVYNVLTAPLAQLQLPQLQWVFLDVQTPLWLPVQVACWTAWVLTTPWFLYEIWAFVTPGLYPQEKRLLIYGVTASSLLWLLGMLFGYTVILPCTFLFVAELLPSQTAFMADMGRYVGFVGHTLWMMGWVFQTPLLTWALIHSGAVPSERMKAARRYVIVGCFFVAMLIAPPDVFSQTLLALPLWGLFELGVWAAYCTRKWGTSVRVVHGAKQ